jgi:hypothetical protein
MELYLLNASKEFKQKYLNYLFFDMIEKFRNIERKLTRRIVGSIPIGVLKIEF